MRRSLRTALVLVPFGLAAGLWDVAAGTVPAAVAQPPAGPGVKVRDDGLTVRTADVKGATVRYLTSGAGEQVIVLLHGWPQDATEWTAVIPAMAKRATVLAPDLPGIGGSSRSKRGYDKSSLAADLHDWLVQLGHN